MPATIAVFAYRRPHHLQACLDALSSNDIASESKVHIFVDGPKGPKDIDLVEEVADVATQASGFRSVQISRSRINLGLSKSVTTGIDTVLKAEDRIIVVEDDILTSIHFLSFMNDHLEQYSNDARVASVHGYVYPHPQGILPETFFVKGADCWGWATWKRAWKFFNPDGEFLLAQLRLHELINEFTFNGFAPFDDMLLDQIAGRNDSWAVRWHASALLADMLTLYPDQPMAVNIGEDGSGSHGGKSTLYTQALSPDRISVSGLDPEENSDARRLFEDFFLSRYHLPQSHLGRLAWRYMRRLKRKLAK